MEPLRHKIEERDEARWSCLDTRKITLMVLYHGDKRIYEDKNRGFADAFKKGWQAYVEGEPKAACPYPDHRTHRGTVTFSRAYRTEWQNGWRRAAKEAANESWPHRCKDREEEHA